jgi:uncharacterized heparinase superfamily protein
LRRRGRAKQPRCRPNLVQALRTTAAHSTLTLGDRNSTAILEDGSLGKGVTQVELSRDETRRRRQVEASHDGYVRRFGLVHQRRSPQQRRRELEGEDVLIPKGKQAAQASRCRSPCASTSRPASR